MTGTTAMILWTILGFFSGAIPFAWLSARLAGGGDIRTVGDGNPGACNAFKAGGWRAGVPALLLDFLKAAVPVGIARHIVGLSGWSLVPVAVAPVLGHALSPFLGGRGGKAITAAFGMWAGLTLGTGPLVFGALLTGLYFGLDSHAWAAVIAAAATAAAVALFGDGPEVVTAGILAAAIIAARQGRLLKTLPRPRKSRGGGEAGDG